MQAKIEQAQPSDASPILNLQRIANRSEAAIYGNQRIPPLTQTLSELQGEFTDHVFLKALDGVWSARCGRGSKVLRAASGDSLSILITREMASVRG